MMCMHIQHLITILSLICLCLPYNYLQISWLAIKDPPSQFSKLGIQVSGNCLSIWGLYAFASHMYTHTRVHIIDLYFCFDVGTDMNILLLFLIMCYAHTFSLHSLYLYTWTCNIGQIKLQLTAPYGFISTLLLITWRGAGSPDIPILSTDGTEYNIYNMYVLYTWSGLDPGTHLFLQVYILS